VTVKIKIFTEEIEFNHKLHGKNYISFRFYLKEIVRDILLTQQQRESIGDLEREVIDFEESLPETRWGVRK